jgi:hypothetical protein
MALINGNVDATQDSYPYVTGMGFRNRAHTIYDEFHQDDPSAVMFDGHVVFVKTDLVAPFFSHVMPKIYRSIRLITHNSAIGISKDHEVYLNDPRIISWHAQNANFEHPKLFSLPLGLANQRWAHGDLNIIRKVSTARINRDNLVYMNFDLNTNRERRSMVYDKFHGKDYVLETPSKSFADYLRDLRSSKYVLSPPGRGIDCHRVWESILMGAIPIVERSHNMSFYEEMPIILVDDWDTISKEWLEGQYDEIKSKDFEDVMKMDYWIDKLGLLSEPRPIPAGVIVPPGCKLADGGTK